MPRLNWGCGPDQPEGWFHSDLVGWKTGQHHVGDIAAGLPWPDGFFHYAVSHHALQMIPWPQLVPTLSELRRVIAPGGWLRLSVPSLLGAMQAWEDDDSRWFPIADEIERSIDGKLCVYLSQAGATRSVFTERWLCELMERAGFLEPKVAGCLVTDGLAGICDLDSRCYESVYVEARA